MTDYTVEEIDAILLDEGEEDDFWDEDSWGAPPTITLRGEEVEYKNVAGKYPEEGGGETIWSVIKVGDQFFKKTGYYASHDGAYWDGATTEVHPVERTATFYE